MIRNILKIVSLLLLFHSFSVEIAAIPQAAAQNDIAKFREIAMEFNGNIMIKTMIVDKANNGKLYRFIVDTGAPFCLISSALDKKLKTPRLKTVSVSDFASRSRDLKYTVLNMIGIGGVAFHDAQATVVDFSDMLNFYPCSNNDKNVDGIIGLNLLSSVECWQFDYAGKKVRFGKRDAFDAMLQDAIKIPFRIENWRIIVKSRIADKFSWEYQIDTGSYRSFSNPFERWGKIGKLKPLYVNYIGFKSSGLYGIGKKIKYCTALIDDIRLGQLHLPRYDMDFSNGVNCVIGNAFFKEYIMTLDFKNNVLFLKKNTEKSEPAYINPDFFNFIYDSKNKWVIVNAMAENSSAYKAGLQIGDRIVCINDLKTEALSCEEYRQFGDQFSQKYGAAECLKLTIRRGEVDREYQIKVNSKIGVDTVDTKNLFPGN